MSKTKATTSTLTLGQRLKSLRFLKQEKQWAMANIIGLRHPVYCDLENDRKKRVTSGVLARLADAYGVSMDELHFGIGRCADDVLPRVKSVHGRSEIGLVLVGTEAKPKRSGKAVVTS